MLGFNFILNLKIIEPARANKLGKLCCVKRQKNGKLAKDKIKLLVKLPGWYWSKESDKKIPINSKKYSGSKTNKEQLTQ